MRKARIENGVVVEILDTGPAPFPQFTPDLQWVECGADVRQDWTFDGATFTPPVEEVVEPLPEDITLPAGTQGAGAAPQPPATN